MPFTEKYGLEVGANIFLLGKEYSIRDVTLGGHNGVAIPRLEHAVASIHTHPANSRDGFSGTLRYVDGKLRVYWQGDYGHMYTTRTSGYAYRAGDGAGWYFDYPAFSSALSAAERVGADTYAEWYTRRLP